MKKKLIFFAGLFILTCFYIFQEIFEFIPNSSEKEPSLFLLSGLLIYFVSTKMLRTLNSAIDLILNVFVNGLFWVLSLIWFEVEPQWSMALFSGIVCLYILTIWVTEPLGDSKYPPRLIRLTLLSCFQFILLPAIVFINDFAHGTQSLSFLTFLPCLYLLSVVLLLNIIFAFSQIDPNIKDRFNFFVNFDSDNPIFLIRQMSKILKQVASALASYFKDFWRNLEINIVNCVRVSRRYILFAIAGICHFTLLIQIEKGAKMTNDFFHGVVSITFSGFLTFFFVFIFILIAYKSLLIYLFTNRFQNRILTKSRYLQVAGMTLFHLGIFIFTFWFFLALGAGFCQIVASVVHTQLIFANLNPLTNIYVAFIICAGFVITVTAQIDKKKRASLSSDEVLYVIKNTSIAFKPTKDVISLFLFAMPIFFINKGLVNSYLNVHSSKIVANKRGSKDMVKTLDRTDSIAVLNDSVKLKPLLSTEEKDTLDSALNQIEPPNAVFAHKKSDAKPYAHFADEENDSKPYAVFADEGNDTIPDPVFARKKSGKKPYAHFAHKKSDAKPYAHFADEENDSKPYAVFADEKK